MLIPPNIKVVFFLSSVTLFLKLPQDTPRCISKEMLNIIKSTMKLIPQTLNIILGEGNTQCPGSAEQKHPTWPPERDLGTTSPEE